MAVFFGFGACLSTVSPSIIASRTFGTKNYPEIFGVTTILVNGGYAIGVPVIGLFYDMTGSYYPAWIVMGMLAVLMPEATQCRRCMPVPGVSLRAPPAA